MHIRPFEKTDVSQAVVIWNEASASGDTVFAPMTEDTFIHKFMENEHADPECFLTAVEEERLVGFAHGVMKHTFLADENAENTPGYVTAVYVDKAFRKRGIGSALLKALEDVFAQAGKTAASISSNNPVNLSWLIPGTPGHDHNNAPGLDLDAMAYDFFAHRGYCEHYREVSMYVNLTNYPERPDIQAKKEKLANEGIYTGRYDVSWDCDFDGMCDRVGSEYWRAVLREEIAAHKENRACADARFYADGIAPKGPRPILTAVHEGKIVGFTGPVDLQKSGRGFFTGICTDPLYGGRGIAAVLFDMLMREFVAEGAAFSTLFTGETNHAQKIYLGAGMRPVRRFCIMHKPLTADGQYQQTHF